jgi:hypothetical protein
VLSVAHRNCLRRRIQFDLAAHATLLFSFSGWVIDIFKDEVGEVFSDAALALQHAKKIALELARRGKPARASITVAEGDRQLFEVPLSDQSN